MPTRTYYRKQLEDGKWEVGYISKNGEEKTLTIRWTEEGAIRSINHYENVDLKLSAAFERIAKKLQDNPESFYQLMKNNQSK